MEFSIENPFISLMRIARVHVEHHLFSQQWIDTDNAEVTGAKRPSVSFVLVLKEPRK